ncbi:MAG: hypothetical protein Fur0022_16060 [Anaerolineales bacterium]
MNAFKRIFLSLVLACLLVGSFVWLSASFNRPTQAEPEMLDWPPPIATYDPEHPLKELAASQGLLLGTTDGAFNQLYINTIPQEFSSVTPENLFKFENIHPCPPAWLLSGPMANSTVITWVVEHGTDRPGEQYDCYLDDPNLPGTGPTPEYDWTEADTFVGWAASEGLGIYVTPLVWWNQNPGWLVYANADLTVTLTIPQLYQVMDEHIRGVINHYCQNYAGAYSSVYAMDVVNEGILANPPSATYAYRSIWQLLTPQSDARVDVDFINEAFQIADDALTDCGHREDVKLFYNEYAAEYIGDAQTEAVYDYFTFLQNAVAPTSLPIDGIGFQAHLIYSTTLPLGEQHNWLNLLNNMNRFTRDFGMEIKITELDVWINDGTFGYPSDPDLPDYYQGQAEIYGRVAAACIHADNCTGITIWGTNDRDSWVHEVFQRDMDPLLFWDRTQLIYSPTMQTCLTPTLVLSGQVLNGETDNPVSSVSIDLVGEYATSTGLQTTVLDTLTTNSGGNYTFALSSLPAPPTGSSGWTRLLIQVSPPAGTVASAADAPLPGYAIHETTLAYGWSALTPGANFADNNFTLLFGHLFTGEVMYTTQPVAGVPVHLEAEYAQVGGGIGIVPILAPALPTDADGKYTLTLLASTLETLTLPPDGTAWTNLRVVVSPPPDYVAASAQVSPPGLVASPNTIAYPWNTPGGVYPDNHFTLAQTITFDGKITNPTGWAYPYVPVSLSAEYVKVGTLQGTLEIPPGLPPGPGADGPNTSAYTLFFANPQGTLVQTVAFQAPYQSTYNYTLALPPGSYQVYARIINSLSQVYYSSLYPLAISSQMATGQNFPADQLAPPTIGAQPNPPPFTLAFGHVLLNTTQSDLGGEYSLTAQVNALWPTALPADGGYWTRLLLENTPPEGTLPYAAGPATPPGWAANPTQIEYPVGLPYAAYGQNHFQLYTPPPTQPPAEFQGRVVAQAGEGIPNVSITLSAEFLQAGYLMGQLSLTPSQGSELIIQRYALTFYHPNGTLIERLEYVTSQQLLSYLRPLTPGAYQAYLKVHTSGGAFYSPLVSFTISSGQNTSLDLTANLPTAPIILPLSPVPPFTLAYGWLPIQNAETDAEGYFSLEVDSLEWPLLPPTAVSWTALSLSETIPPGYSAHSASVPPPGFVVQATQIGYPWGLGGSTLEEGGQTIWAWGGQGNNGGLFPDNEFVLELINPTPTPTLTPTPVITPSPTTPPPTFTPTASSTNTPTPAPTSTIHLAFLHPSADSLSLVASQTHFQAEAWEPGVGNTNGTGIVQVVFHVYDPNQVLVFSRTDTTIPYCVWQQSGSTCLPRTNLSAQDGYYKLIAQAWTTGGQASPLLERLFKVILPTPTPSATATVTPTPPSTPTPGVESPNSNSLSFYCPKPGYGKIYTTFLTPPSLSQLYLNMLAKANPPTGLPPYPPPPTPGPTPTLFPYP